MDGWLGVVADLGGYMAVDTLCVFFYVQNSLEGTRIDVRRVGGV